MVSIIGAANTEGMSTTRHNHLHFPIYWELFQASLCSLLHKCFFNS